MRSGVLIIIFMCIACVSDAAVHYPLSNADHVRRAKINKGLGIGTGSVGLGLLLYTGTRHVVQDAYWDDQQARWNFEYSNGLISEDQYSKQMLKVKEGREDLRAEVRRNYVISGGLFAASMAFFLNAHRHTMKITEETTFSVTPGGVSLAYRF